jgi:hypothetical protein
MNFEHKTFSSSGIDSFSIQVDLDSPLLDIIRVATLFSQEFALCSGAQLADQSHLFLNHTVTRRGTGPCCYQSMNSLFKSILETLAIPSVGITLHSIRATRAMDIRMDHIMDQAAISATASSVGWKSPAMAQRYTQLAQGFLACRNTISPDSWALFVAQLSSSYGSFLFFRNLAGPPTS